MSTLKPQNVSAQELKFAYRLLLKIHGQVDNSYLLLAIIAWARENNKVKRVGWVNEAALNRSVAAVSKVLLTAKYRAVLAALKHAPAKDYDMNGDGSIDAGSGMQKQALDFFYAIVQSPWSRTHYGMSATQLKDPNALFATALYKRWLGLLGHKITMPADTIPQPKPPPPPPQPNQPRTLQHAVPHREYIAPYASRDFYNERHEAPNFLPGDAPPTW